MVVLAPLAASAGVDGARLADVCRSADTAACTAYVAGVFDGLTGLKGLGRFRACLPEDVSEADLASATQRYLQRHPEDRQGHAIELVVKSWAEAWPCGPGPYSAVR